MKFGIARIGDITRGECTIDGPQTGRIIGGSNNVLSENGRGIARARDLVLAECGHTGRIITDDNTVSVNQKSVARVGSRVEGNEYTAIVITGSRDIS